MVKIRIFVLSLILNLTVTVAELDIGKDREKRDGVGIESCLNIYTVPKRSVVCDPPVEVTLAISNLKAKSEEIVGSVDGLNQRLDELDPAVPKDLPQEVKDKLNDIDNLKQTQAGHIETLKRLDSEINDSIRRLALIEAGDRDEVRSLIEQQALLIKITLEKANISLHDQYVNKLTESTSNLLTRLQQLELDLKDKINNENSNLENKLTEQDSRTQGDLTDIRNNLQERLNEFRDLFNGEVGDRQLYYNLSLNHGGVLENLRTMLTSIRENQAQSFTKEQELETKTVQLQSDLESEQAVREEVTRKAADLEAALELVQDRVYTSKNELQECRNETGQLREDLDKIIEHIKKREHIMPRALKIHDCQDVLRFYFPSSGVYDINPNPSTRPFKVFCDLIESEGWTVIQRRQDGSTDFFLGWEDYREGFGVQDGEYWLGLQHIHTMTTTRNYTLRVEVEDWNNRWYWAEYEHFYVDSEEEKYSLHVTGYSGDAGDSLSYHDKMPFSTFDRNNDNNKGICATWCHGAWWYDNCFSSNLNGKYYHQGPYLTSTNWGDGLVWKTVHTTNYYSMKASVMKVKPHKAQV